MKIRTIAVLIVTIAIIAVAVLAINVEEEEESDTEIKVNVVHVIDGDTIDVLMPDGSKERVRLLGVDTPEIKENRPNEYDSITNITWLDIWGEKAEKYTKDMIEDRYVHLKTDEMAGERDSYGRLLAYLILEDGSDFNALLVHNGYARVYTEGEFLKEDEYIDFQRIAQQNDVGLWGYSEPPIPEPVEEETTFMLESWEVGDDDGYPSLTITFNASDDVYLLLADPKGVEIDYEWCEKGIKGARLHLDDYWDTPSAGDYTLIVKDWYGWDIISAETFHFEGVKLDIDEIEPKWEEYDDYYSLVSLRISMENRGDLPAYLCTAEIEVDGESDTSYIYTVVLPNEEKKETISTYFYFSVIPEYHIEVSLKDDSGNVVAVGEEWCEIEGLSTLEIDSSPYDGATVWINTSPNPQFDYYNNRLDEQTPVTVDVLPGNYYYVCCNIEIDGALWFGEERTSKIKMGTNTIEIEMHRWHTYQWKK